MPVTDTIFLLVGKSGSGKTTLCDQVSTIMGLTPIESYTTRKPRYAGEGGHTFVDSFEQWRREHPTATIVGYTYFMGNHYWATGQQVDEHDIYVIDPDGVEFMRNTYCGTKQIRVIYIDATPAERFHRMCRRGDGAYAAIRRILHDAVEFKGWRNRADYVVVNHDLTAGLEQLWHYIAQVRHLPRWHCEKYESSECLKCDDGYTDDGAIYCRRDLL
jgi:guanylate kinase